MPKILPWFLGLALPLFALDQATKEWTIRHFSEPPTGTNSTLDAPIHVIERIFHITRVHNTGVSWGMFAGHAASNWIFGILSTSVLLALVTATLRGRFALNTPSRIAVALIVAGILGNLTDRLRLGYVVDFIHIIYGGKVLFGSDSFPCFNVADSCICVGAVLFFLCNLREPATDRQAAATAAAAVRPRTDGES